MAQSKTEWWLNHTGHMAQYSPEYSADVKMRDEIIHESCILISRNKVNLKSDLEYLKIDDDIYFVKVKENVNG